MVGQSIASSYCLLSYNFRHWEPAVGLTSKFSRYLSNCSVAVDATQTTITQSTIMWRGTLKNRQLNIPPYTCLLSVTLYQWLNCKIRARGTLSPPFPFHPPSAFLFPYPFLPLPLPLPFPSPPLSPLRSRPLKSS